MEAFKIEHSREEIIEFVMEFNSHADNQIPMPYSDIVVDTAKSTSDYVQLTAKTINGDYGTWGLTFKYDDMKNPISDDVWFKFMPASDPYAFDELKVGMVFTVLPAYVEWYQASMKQFGGLHVGDVVYLFKVYEDSCEFYSVGAFSHFIVPRADVSKFLRYALGSFVPNETRGYKW